VALLRGFSVSNNSNPRAEDTSKKKFRVQCFRFHH